MAHKVFVGNLPWSTTSEQLRELFASVGQVESAEVRSDYATGRSKGFGFVEMSTPEEKQAAIDQLNGKELEGRKITVDEPRPKASA